MIELIAITALFLYGTKVLYQPGMVFEKPVKWLDTCIKVEVSEYLSFNVDGSDPEKITRKVVPGWWKWLKKPLYACPACMSSVWGSLVYWVYYVPCETFLHSNLMDWPIFLISVCGLVWILLWQFPFDD